MCAQAFMEPFKIKMTERLPLLSMAERRRALIDAGYNLFRLGADSVTIDLLTDSGTGAMSDMQWAAMMRGDETYAGARSFELFREAVAELTGFRHILPVHQGRAAERIVLGTLIAEGTVSISNTHFDTTRANVEIAGGEAVDLPCPASVNLRDESPFKGNIDLGRLQARLSDPGCDVAVVVITVTNNAGGGQPVSPENVKAAAAMCHAAGVPLFIDGARFAENGYLVTQRDAAYANWTPKAVAQAIFGEADGAWISLKKDGLGNIGGVLAVADDGLAERCRNLLIATEGFPSYGGLRSPLDTKRKEHLDLIPALLAALTASEILVALDPSESGPDSRYIPLHRLKLRGVVSYGGDSPVPAKNPSMSPGTYCICLSRVLTSRLSTAMVPGTRLARPRLRLDHTPSAGLSSGA